MVDLFVFALGCFCAWILGANYGANWASRHRPASGTHVMPVVVLPDDFEPPSAAVR